MILKWAWREIFRGWRLSLFFVLNISLGLTGYISIEAFKGSLQNYLAANSKQILSADLSVSARRMLTEQEQSDVRRIIGKKAVETQTLDFFAMLNFGSGSRLVSVKAIDPVYPFYGSLKLEHSGIINSDSPKALFQTDSFWSYQDLKYQLNLKPGDEVSLGKLKVHLNDFVLEELTPSRRYIRGAGNSSRSNRSVNHMLYLP